MNLAVYYIVFSDLVISKKQYKDRISQTCVCTLTGTFFSLLDHEFMQLHNNFFYPVQSFCLVYLISLCSCIYISLSLFPKSTYTSPILKKKIRPSLLAKVTYRPWRTAVTNSYLLTFHLKAEHKSPRDKIPL